MPCKSRSLGCHSLWNEKSYNVTAHNTRHVFQNCSLIAPCLAPACLPYALQTNSDLLWKSMQKACLIRGSILQCAQGLHASEQLLSRLQNNPLWCYVLAKDVSVIKLCTNCICCNRIWTKVLCCKSAIFSPANCKQWLYKLWAMDEGFLKSS